MRAAPPPPDGWLPPGVLAAHLAWLGLRGLSETYIRSRRDHLRRMGGTVRVPLLEATEADLIAWRAALDVSPRAVKNAIVQARQFWDWAIAEKLCETNPAARLPVPRVTRTLPRPVADDDLMAALDAAAFPVRLQLVLAGWCGLRAQEIARLCREHIYDTAAEPVLLVDAAAAKGRRERLVPLASFVLAELHAARLPRAGYVFRRGDGKPGPNQPWQVSHLCNQHLHDCGLDATLHQLRHRFATAIYQSSRDLLMTQHVLGHANPASTAIYAAWSQENARAAVAALPVPRRKPQEVG